jgi:hypothetical protein
MHNVHPAFVLYPRFRQFLEHRVQFAHMRDHIGIVVYEGIIKRRSWYPLQTIRLCLSICVLHTGSYKHQYRRQKTSVNKMMTTRFQIGCADFLCREQIKDNNADLKRRVA